VILVDTSVWIEHLRVRHERLATALEDGEVAMHPFVIGELACGHLPNRAELLRLWSRLPVTPIATTAEALDFIERRRLMALGLGYVDVHLLVSVALDPGTKLWTGDKALSAVASRLGFGYHG
jgi:predicted nucleic acid-binding protein